MGAGLSRDCLTFLILFLMGANGSLGQESLSDRFVRWLSPSVRAMDVEIESLRERSEGLPEPAPFNRSVSLGYHSSPFYSDDELSWIEIDLKKEQEFDQIALLPVFVEMPLFEGRSYGFPVRFKIEVFWEDRTDPILVADHSEEDYDHVHGYPFRAPFTKPIVGRYVRMTSLRHAKVLDRWGISLAEILILNGPLNVAVGCPVTVGPSPGYGRIGWNRNYLTDFCSPLGPPVVAETSPTNGLRCIHGDDPETVKWVQVDLGDAVLIDAIRLLPSRPTDTIDSPGTGFPVQFKIEASNDPAFSKKQLIFSSSPEAYPNPGDNPVEIHAEGEVARYLRITATRLSNLAARYSFSLSEMQMYSKGRNAALGKQVSASDVFDNPIFPRWKPSALVDGYNSQNRLIELPDWLAGLEERRQLSARLLALENEREQKSETIVVAATTGTLAISGILAIGAVGFSMSYQRKKKKETEEVRRQIARDLHDDIGGDLGGILLISEGVLQRPGLSDEVCDELRDIHDIAKGSNEALHDIVWLIREERDLADLVLRLREMAQLLLRKIPFAWEVLPETIPARPAPLNVRRHVFFAFKEALTNIAKHADAEQVTIAIEISTTPPSIALRLVDDGRGFDPEVDSKGYGLRNLRRRCQALNGNCEIVSTPGEGTRIDLVFSLKD